MASNVVVIDSTARRHTIKTTPQKHLSDILQEACAKFGVNASHYGLRHNDKPVELSRTMRLSGLSPGAKLTLVQISRTPTAVSVALQLPASIAPTPTRLTDKFASDTSLWQILRRFESGAAGGAATEGKNFNFTQRATPLMANGAGAGSGAGRLCYEMPTFNVLGKQLDSLTDLGKTLSQLGISGSALLRLDFRNTQKPLEEAMAEISSFFQAVEEPPTASAAGAARVQAAATVAPAAEAPPPSEPTAMDTREDTPGQQNNSQPQEGTAASTSESQAPPATSTVDPKITVYTAPASATPAAATSFDAEDYVPTADHARSHQALLNRSSRNKKLLSDAELEAGRQEKRDALSAVESVTVRLRFPDQSLVQRACSKDDTLQTLYAVCREVMDRPGQEQIVLRAASTSGPSLALNDAPHRLIQDLGWTGRVLVTVAWADGVDAAAKARPSLKPSYRQQAQELKVKEVMAEPEPENKGRQLGSSGKEAAQTSDKSGKGGEDKEKRMMNRLLGKLSKK